MPSGNFIVTSLPAYVQENRDILVKDAVLGASTISRMRVQTGIKKDAYLNYLAVEPEFRDGRSCDWEPSGTVELTDRVISTALLAINMTICPKNLVGTYAEYLVRYGDRQDEMPYERYVMDGIRRWIRKQLDKLIWQADTASATPSLAFFDGLLKIGATDIPAGQQIAISASGAYAGLLEVYNALPEEVLAFDNVRIFVSPAIFRAFAQELVALNLFHYEGPRDGETYEEHYLPGTKAIVTLAPGLEGSLKVLATYEDNLYYGTDLESDSEVVKVIYDEKTDAFNLKVLFNAGAQIAFPDRAVIGTFAAAPSAAVPGTRQVVIANTSDNPVPTQEIA